MASDYYNIIFKHFLNIRMQYLRNNSWQPYICAHLTMGWAFIFDYFFLSASEGYNTNINAQPVVKCTQIYGCHELFLF